MHLDHTLRECEEMSDEFSLEDTVNEGVPLFRGAEVTSLEIAEVGSEQIRYVKDTGHTIQSSRKLDIATDLMALIFTLRSTPIAAPPSFVAALTRIYNVLEV